MSSGEVSVETILKALRKLGPAELERVREEVTILSALDGIDTSEDWLLEGIIWFLREEKLAATIPRGFRITNRRSFRGYVGKAEKVRGVFERHMKLTKVDRIALGRVVVRCLAEKVKEFREVSLNSLLGHVDLSLMAWEDAFPGYLASGLLSVVLRGLSRAGG